MYKVKRISESDSGIWKNNFKICCHFMHF